MKVDIGGNRLGAGNKMSVDLKTYDRSTHDLGYIWRSTMAAGTLVPFISEVGLPGDTFDIDLDIDVKTHPTIGPLFGSYKVQADVFMVPIRLYIAALHNNDLGIGMKMKNVLVPQIHMQADTLFQGKEYDNQQINPSSLFAYLNMRGLGFTQQAESLVTRDFNAVPYLGYWDIYKNYYANKQEEVGAYIHNERGDIDKNITKLEILQRNDAGQVWTEISKYPISTNLDTTATSQIRITTAAQNIDLSLNDVFLNTAQGRISAAELWPVETRPTNVRILGTNPGRVPIVNVRSWDYATGTDPIDRETKVQFFDLKNIDAMRKSILIHDSVQPYSIYETTPAPYGPPLGKSQDGTLWNKLQSQEGLGLKTYQSDMFNNWMQTEWIDGDNGINAITAVDTSDGKFTIDTLNLANKVYIMMNRIAMSGGSYDDWLNAVYTHERMRSIQTPVYMGGLSKELVFQEVVSNSESAEGQPLGTLAGKGVMSNKHKGGTVVVKVDEPCYVMGIVSITPRMDYSQGNKWDVNLKTMDDFHKPALDEIGFQDLVTDQMHFAETEIGANGEVIFQSAGKQPAWINYMTNVNRVYGNFAIPDNEMFMTLNRRYEVVGGERYSIKDLTTYIDPQKANYIFAETARDAQNFWTQIRVDIKARRKMSAKVMPNL